MSRRHSQVTAAAREAPHEPLWADTLHLVLAHGTLATRLLAAAGEDPSREDLRAVYARLFDYLAAEEPFLA